MEPADESEVGPSPGEALMTRVLGLVQALRNAALPVSTVEALDAMASLGHVSLADPEQFRAALGATLVKREADLGLFQEVFETHFRRRPPGPSSGSVATSTSPAKDLDPLDGTEDLLSRLVQALKTGDLEALRSLAALSVTRFA